MDLRGRSPLPYYFGLFISLVVLRDPVCCMKVTAPEEITAVKGDAVTLTCTFSSTSRITSRMSVSWSFRPQSGGPPQTFFHFLSSVYPPTDERFKGRVKWLGSPSLSDASIQLLNASLNDNGTYTCSVLNPPDVHGAPAHIVLTVTPKKMVTRFSDVAVLLAFILLPSGLIALVLLSRILCPCCSHTENEAAISHHSPIEVTDGEQYVYQKPFLKQRTPTCCELYFLDEEDYYHDYEKHHVKTMESEL